MANNQKKSSSKSEKVFIYKGFKVSEKMFKDLTAAADKEAEAKKAKESEEYNKSQESQEVNYKFFDYLNNFKKTLATSYKFLADKVNKFVPSLLSYESYPTSKCDNNFAAEWEYCSGSKYGKLVSELKVISMPKYEDARTKQNTKCLIEKFENKPSSCAGMKFTKGEIYFQLNNMKEGRFDPEELLKFVDKDTSAKDIALYSYDLYYSTRNSKEKNCEHNHELLAKYMIDEVKFTDFLVEHTA